MEHTSVNKKLLIFQGLPGEDGIDEVEPPARDHPCVMCPVGPRGPPGLEGEIGLLGPKGPGGSLGEIISFLSYSSSYSFLKVTFQP